MKKNITIKKAIERNWFFFIMFFCIIVVFARRYAYLSVDIVSHPDSQITFSTQDMTLEQTWQPEVKAISGIQVPYYAENGFSCDVQLKVFSDDYSEVLVEAVKENCIFTEGETGNIAFSFGRTKVIQGERYRIQLSLLNASTEGTLQIASGSNYGGCSISDESVNQAAAIKITFVKYSKLFWLLAVLFPLLSFSLLLMVLTGRKWEEVVCLSVLCEGTILYFFGLFEHLPEGLFTVYVFAILCMAVAIWLYNKKDLSIKDLLSPGLWIYFILFIIIIVTSNGDWLGYRDEMRHWGIAVRDMFYYDSFAKHANTTLILPSYLPFTALMEYAFVYMNGLFSEDILFIAYQTMLLSVLIVLSKPLQKQNGRKLLVPIMVAMICVPVIFFNNISNSIMVDSLLAAIVAYTLICYYSEKMTLFNRARIVVALIALTLIKDMGLVFAGLTALIMFGDVLCMQIKERKLRVKELLYPILYVVMILIVYFSWQIYLNAPIKNVSESVRKDIQTVDTQVVYDQTEDSYEVGDKASMYVSGESGTDTNIVNIGGIPLDGLVKVLSGEGEKYQYQITRNFLKELFDGETYTLSLFKVSFFDFLAVIAFFAISLGWFGYWQRDKERMYAFAGLILVAGVCLCTFLQITYWFKFSRYEALELTSIDRYLAPFVCAVVIVIFFQIYNEMLQKQKASPKINYLIFALSAFFVISMPIEGIITEGKDIEGNTTEEITYGYDMITEILRSVAKRGEKAYYICSNSDGYSEYVFRNSVCPIVSEHENWNIVADQELFEEQYVLYGEAGIDDNVAEILSVEQWEEQLWECQYVVVFHADELFTESYGEVFGGDSAIGDGCVYQVTRKDSELSLELIGQTGIKGWH